MQTMDLVRSFITQPRKTDELLSYHLKVCPPGVQNRYINMFSNFSYIVYYQLLV